MSVIIYLDHIEELEQENEELKQEFMYLRTLIEYDSKSSQKSLLIISKQELSSQLEKGL